jgi:tRNA threonylcarbamoyladenosine biosynthesis protein TsaB
MLLLALDTATSAVTVALHDGDRVLAEASTVDPRAHGERLAPGIDAVLREAGVAPGHLTHIVCGLGPGPFTGLRVGIVTARVLALATGAALHGVCSLDALAYAAATAALALPGDELLVATDARRKEVYWARYAVSAPDAVSELGPVVTARTAPSVVRPAELPPALRDLPTAGRGPLLYPELFGRAVPPWDVDAAALARLAVARLAAGDPLADHEPYYLRRPDAAPNVTRKSALG